MSDNYDFERLPIDFIQFVKDLQVHAKHEQHSYRLARALQIRVRVALHNSALPNGNDGPLIFLQPWYFAGDNDVTRHEIAHVMLWWSGLEARILTEYGLELGGKIIERLCNQAIAFLRIPQPLVDAAIKRHGVSAHAIRALIKRTRAPYEMCMERLIFDDPSAERAGFMTSGKYISAVAVCNFKLPFWLSHRVPEPQLVIPEASLIRLPHHAGLLGVVSGSKLELSYWDGA